MLNGDAIPMPPQTYATWRNIAAIALEVVASCENSREMRLENARSANRKKISELMSLLGFWATTADAKLCNFCIFRGFREWGTLHLAGEPNRPLAACALMAAVRTS